jgi:hypothetical protein
VAFYSDDGEGCILTFMQNNLPIDPRLERYLELCQRIYERMERDGTWPWKSDDIPHDDSTLSESLIDSESHQQNV